MIAYEILVQTIADWKAGVRPSAPNVPPPAGAPAVVEEYESGMVDLEEGQYEEGQYEAQPEYEYAEGEYAEGEYATETYEDDEQQ